MGKWKGIRKNIFKGNLDIELYNLETDIKELNDLSKTHPKIVSAIDSIMKMEHTPAENTTFRMQQLGDK
jgi:arylsulfatase